MPSTGVELLCERVNELDSADIGPGVADEPTVRFTRLMAAWTSTKMTVNSEQPVVLDPADADAITAGCRLLEEIARENPDLVRGPLDTRRQQWIGTASADAGVAPPELTRQAFVGAGARRGTQPSTKPFGLGLYSSTATGDGRSMWRVFLDIGRERSLHPRPWSVWDLRLDSDRANVCEITSAAAWCALVQTCPTHAGGRLYPDWHAIASDFDGIHMTLAAIVATQGFTLQTVAGPIAPTYWDLESTLWLRWRFESASLREVVG
jgi:hypothetical protein